MHRWNTDSERCLGSNIIFMDSLEFIYAIHRHRKENRSVLTRVKILDELNGSLLMPKNVLNYYQG